VLDARLGQLRHVVCSWISCHNWGEQKWQQGMKDGRRGEAGTLKEGVLTVPLLLAFSGARILGRVVGMIGMELASSSIDTGDIQVIDTRREAGGRHGWEVLSLLWLCLARGGRWHG